MSDNNWFLELNTIADQVIDNSSLKLAQETQGVPNPIESLRSKMKDFLIQVKHDQLLTVDKDNQAKQAQSFAKSYQDLMIGLSQLFLALEDPQEAKGQFDYGAEFNARTTQGERVQKLYDFIDKFYTELILKHPELPIPYSVDEPIKSLCSA